MAQKQRTRSIAMLRPALLFALLFVVLVVPAIAHGQQAHQRKLSSASAAAESREKEEQHQQQQHHKQHQQHQQQGHKGGSAPAGKHQNVQQKPSGASADSSSRLPPVPHIIHHMHKDLEALDETQAMLRKVCKELHPDWTFMFWSDESLESFIKVNFSSYYDEWKSIHPRIKQLDTSRYMLMHHYGGVYLDVDVECVHNLDDLIAPLAHGTAWMGDFPEPMFLMSAPGNHFWLEMLEHVRNTWKTKDAWHSTGPVGLNDAFVGYLHKHGHGVLVPYLTERVEDEFHNFIKNKNNTVPYYMLANGLARLEGNDQVSNRLEIWHSHEHAHQALHPDHQAVFPASNASSFAHHHTHGAAGQAGGRDEEENKTKTPAKKQELTPDQKYGAASWQIVDEELPKRVEAPENWRVGFISNELLDPAGCGAQLSACRLDLCKPMWPHSYLIHHCLNTWRGRIGDT